MGDAAQPHTKMPGTVLSTVVSRRIQASRIVVEFVLVDLVQIRRPNTFVMNQEFDHIRLLDGLLEDLGGPNGTTLEYPDK